MREQRRRDLTLLIYAIACFTVLVVLGLINLALYPPPDWVKGEVWYGKNLCMRENRLVPCRIPVDNPDQPK